jgi:arylsulfatase A-like enzyme
MVDVHGRGLPHRLMTMMRRRDFLAGAGMAATVSFPVRGAARKPNVILVISDDQGFGDLSIHGNPVLETPNLDRVGREGVRFDQFHVNPVCSPTRASLMTGRYYYRTGVVDTYLGRSMMWPDEVTLPEILRQGGYRTGIFGKWHLGDHYPLRANDQGFEEAVVLHGGGIGQPSDPPGGDHYTDPTLYRNGVAFKSKGYCTDIFFDSAMQFAERNRSKPFFAYIATNAPHDPLEVDEKYVAPFRGKVDEVTAKTFGMIRNLDENMGRLIAKLDSLGLAQDTILIFMTDNGPQRQRYNAGMRGIKGTVYEGGIRVPFFMRWPRRFQAGTVDTRLSAHIDILPTLLEACGVKAPKDLKIDGHSMFGGRDDNRTLFFQWHRGERGRLFEACCARNSRYKLVNGVELYDLQADPAEQTNIAAGNPEVVAKLRAEYEAWFRDVASTRNFEPPRIWLGDPHENPVLLSRQDWRGPEAGWDAKSIGHWEVDVRKPGRYEVEFLFATAAVASEQIRAGLGSVKQTVALQAGSKSVKVQFIGVAQGAGRVEAVIENAVLGTRRGVQYAEVRRVV